MAIYMTATTWGRCETPDATLKRKPPTGPAAPRRRRQGQRTPFGAGCRYLDQWVTRCTVAKALHFDSAIGCTLANSFVRTMPDLTSVQPLPSSPAKSRRSNNQTTATSSISKVAPSSPYGITLEEIRKLNQDQMTEANLVELARIGGVTTLATLLCVNLEHGLPRSEINTNFMVRRELFGRNVFVDAPMKGLFRLFVESLQDTTLIILIIAAIASMVTGYMEHPATGWSEGVAILFGVTLVAVVTSINNYTKEKQFRALSAKHDDVLVKVLRDGKPDQVSVGEISVGDVIILETGDKIPADAVLIHGSDLKCNESSLTGEPDDVSKVPKNDPFLLSSCLVASGRAECLVIAVGAESRWGKIKVQARSGTESYTVDGKARGYG
ncbi:hypothetical protein ON010_g8181 [Phytophthora cinnamomi]|nr:hypothetical protein ON010_g8181 [Phytophthora cinnamomi]